MAGFLGATDFCAGFFAAEDLVALLAGLAAFLFAAFVAPPGVPVLLAAVGFFAAFDDFEAAFALDPPAVLLFVSGPPVILLPASAAPVSAPAVAPVTTEVTTSTTASFARVRMPLLDLPFFALADDFLAGALLLAVEALAAGRFAADVFAEVFFVVAILVSIR